MKHSLYDIVKQVADKHGISVQDVNDIMQSVFKKVALTMKSATLEHNEAIYVPYWGRFYPRKYRLNRLIKLKDEGNIT